jgi:Transposase DDE domain
VLLLAGLRGAGLPDFSRAAADSSHLRAMKGGPATGPSPVDRSKTGSKHHLIVEAHGVPLAAITTGGNRHDVTQLLPLIQAIPRYAAWAAGPGNVPGICTPTVATVSSSAHPLGDPRRHPPSFVTPGCAVICWRRLRTTLCQES